MQISFILLIYKFVGQNNTLALSQPRAQSHLSFSKMNIAFVFIMFANSISQGMNKLFKKLLTFGLFIIVSHAHFAQDTTAVHLHPSKSSKLKGFIVPVALMSAGLFIHETNGSFSKVNIQNNVQENFAINTKIDDYVQYCPFVLFATMKAFGKKGENSTKDQLLLLGKSQLIMASTVYILKVKTKTPRPEGAGGRRSFPSGHTSMTFACAAFFYKEYQGTNKLLAWTGYGIATTTGLMRVMNNEHWMSDIAFGAGLGIACTELVYLHHNRKRRSKNKHASLLVLPEVGRQHLGFNLNYKF